MPEAIMNRKLNAKEKKRAKAILKEYGLNFRTYKRLALGELAHNNEIPFEVTTEFSDELKHALKECDEIEKEYDEGKRTGYNSVDEMMRSIFSD